MNHNHPLVYLLLSTALFTLVNCNDPTVIGEDLLTGDELDINFTDTVTLRTYNMTVDSVRTHEPAVLADNFTSFPVGHFNDPVFGTTKSSVAFQVTLFGSSPDFSGAELDSIVLELPYRASQTYGSINEMYSLEVLELSEELFDSIAYYSNREPFETKSAPLATVDYFPAPEDSVQIFSPRNDDFIQLPPQLRIRLDETFSEQFFNADSLNFQTVDAFLKYFKGIFIRPVSENGGLVSFNFGTVNTGMRVYFHRDTQFSEYLFPVTSNNVTTALFDHDYSGAFVEDFLGENSPLADSLLFVQGMSGINFVLEVPYADALDDLVVNKAEIELPIRFLPFDDPDNSPVDQILVYEMLEDGGLRLVEDITRSPSSRLTEIFGGVPEDDDSYRLNISAHFQDMIRSLVSNKMVIRANLKPEKASRVVLNGTGNTIEPAKLNLTFTKY